jgi:hypothetical protein
MANKRGLGGGPNAYCAATHADGLGKIATLACPASPFSLNRLFLAAHLFLSYSWVRGTRGSPEGVSPTTCTARLAHPSEAPHEWKT